jgi:hypothetical protein
MKRLSVVLVVLFAMAMMQTSCGKYEEGPAFTLKTKTARLTGEWALMEMTENGVSVDMEGTVLKWEFAKDGTFKYSVTFMSMNFSFDGEWQFDDNKEHIEMRTMEDGEWSEWEKMEILKLTNDELWLTMTEVDGDETIVTVMKFEKQ